jgi:hypothetical protein
MIELQIWTRVGVRRRGEEKEKEDEEERGAEGEEVCFPYGSGLVGHTLTTAHVVHRRDAAVGG